VFGLSRAGQPQALRQTGWAGLAVPSHRARGPPRRVRPTWRERGVDIAQPLTAQEAAGARPGEPRTARW